ncbi:MAG: sugar phosphate isomerase/epimerase family protein [Christensenellales bacterium]|jgi:sugar phosphate isomerase/epimerase
MYVSVWSNYFYGLGMTPEEKIDTMARCGLGHSELSSEDGAELLGRGDPLKTGRAFREMADDCGVRIPQGHLDLGADISLRETVESLKAWLDLFLAIGVRACVLHYGKGPLAGEAPELHIEERARALRELTGHIAGSDACICLENLRYPHDSTCGALLSLIEAAGGEHLGICLDTGHLNLAGGDPARFVTEAGPWLRALHIADNEGAADQHMLPYGRGTVPWEPFLKALGASGYDGLFNFEIPGETHVPMEIRVAKLRYILEMADYMARIGGFRLER